MTYDYSCLMAKINVPNWKNVTEIVLPKDVYIDENTKGIEDEPHVTILYGLHPDNLSMESFYPALRLLKPFNIYLTGIGNFQNEKYDVLKFNVESKVLNMLNNYVTKNFPNTNKYPTYKPHATISYCRSDTTGKYLCTFTKKYPIPVSHLMLSHPNGNKEYYDISSQLVKTYD